MARYTTITTDRTPDLPRPTRNDLDVSQVAFTFLVDGLYVYEAVSWLDAVNKHLAAHPEARRIYSIVRIN